MRKLITMSLGLMVMGQVSVSANGGISEQVETEGIIQFNNAYIDLEDEQRTHLLDYLTFIEVGSTVSYNGEAYVLQFKNIYTEDEKTEELELEEGQIVLRYRDVINDEEMVAILIQQ